MEVCHQHWKLAHPQCDAWRHFSSSPNYQLPLPLSCPPELRACYAWKHCCALQMATITIMFWIYLPIHVMAVRTHVLVMYESTSFTMYLSFETTGKRCSVVRTASDFWSIPWRGKVGDSYSVPPSQLLCRLVCVWPTFLYAPHAHVKEPISICHEWLGCLTAGGTVTQKYCIHVGT